MNTVSDFLSPVQAKLAWLGNVTDSMKATKDFAGDISSYGKDVAEKLSAGRTLGGYGVPALMYALQVTNPLLLAAGSILGSLFGGEVAETQIEAPPLADMSKINFGMDDLAELRDIREDYTSQSDFSYDLMSAVDKALNVYSLGSGVTSLQDLLSGKGSKGFFGIDDVPMDDFV